MNVLAFDNELNKPANSWPRQLAGGASSGQSCENRVSSVSLVGLLKKIRVIFQMFTTYIAMLAIKRIQLTDTPFFTTTHQVIIQINFVELLQPN